MSKPTPIALLPYCPSCLAKRLSSGSRRVMLFGEAGIGKSTLTNKFAQAFSEQGLPCFCISADPGSPGFGLPGTVSLGAWQDGNWHVLAFEALCTLDAGRFRLPLLTAVASLVRKAPPGLLLIDAPGVVRGIAGSELLRGMVDQLSVDTLLLLAREAKPFPLTHELVSLEIPILPVHAHSQARRPGKNARANHRTQRWRAYLSNARETVVKLSELNVVGAAPPGDVPEAWAGRQCAFIENKQTVGIGEIVTLQADELKIRLPAAAATSQTLLLRDACVDKNGLLVSAAPFPAAKQFVPPPDALPYQAKDDNGGTRLVVKLGAMFAALINGVFGDPLLHLRLHQHQRSLLFDLGDAGRLPTRIAHQVSDVFISHAHIDHIGGFLWFLRSRLGDFPSCRIFGPPGLIAHINGLIAGILWDRIGDTGPRFEVCEIRADRLVRVYMQTGYTDCVDLPALPISNGLIVDDPLFTIHSTTLDHGTPVQAYAFETKPKLSVDKGALQGLDLTGGPWLNQLKALISAGDYEARLRLPDNSVWDASELATHLLKITPGIKLAYATDFADTAANRAVLIALAQQADLLVCEASFLEADIEQARRTGHLTAHACGEIASLANVKQLLPFHFSKRYEKQPEAVYREVGQACSRAIMP